LGCLAGVVLVGLRWNCAGCSADDWASPGVARAALPTGVDRGGRGARPRDPGELLQHEPRDGILALISSVAIVLPVLLWLTARCQPAFGMAGAFIASAGVMLATTFGVGRFGDAAVPLMERVKGAQAATITVTLAHSF
jgi:hypothetical protein